MKHIPLFIYKNTICEWGCVLSGLIRNISLKAAEEVASSVTSLSSAAAPVPNLFVRSH